MRTTHVKLTMLNGTEGFVDPELFKSFNVPESAFSVISSHIRGSHSPLLKIYENKDLTGSSKYINVNFIVEVSFEYQDN